MGQSPPKESLGLQTNVVTVLEIEGVAEFSRKGSQRWDPSYTQQVLYPGDQLRTGERSRAAVRLSDRTLCRLGELSYLQVPGDESDRGTFRFLRGLLYLFHRDKSDQFRFRTPVVSALVRGTEFNLKVTEDGTTTLSVIEGAAELRNDWGTLELASGEEGIVEPGKPPARTAVIVSVNQIQWCLYYPGILDPNELILDAAEVSALTDSITAYRQGDLLQALAKYPTGRHPASDGERVYQAGLLLAVGQVAPAEGILAAIQDQQADKPGGEPNTPVRLANALRTVIAAVTSPSPHAPRPAPLAPRPPLPSQLATEWLAESYLWQAQSDLGKALNAAREAARVSPRFSFGWARVAELEFGFGHVSAARAALETSLEQAPRNAQALALRGYVFAAENKTSQAIVSFNDAIGVDGALGNAWLGRGLCQIRQGRLREGVDDLHVAVTLEPQRAFLRSYLAKAYSSTRDDQRALHEISLAKEMDPNDPTSWLYSALLNQQANRVNEAVADLEQSQVLNANRSVYRSGLLLDQDQAVRGANLAGIYRDAGMMDVSAHEAGRAVNLDYANYSAHLFLANSYLEQLDPRQFNLRYESARVSEYLVATLLSPVGAGVLSQPVSAQEYSRLFERDGLGLYSSTEYLSRGAWKQYGAQYGRLGNSSYSIDGFYGSDPGQRMNNDLELIHGSFQWKQQVTPKDSVYLQTVLSRSRYGDLAQVYDPLAEGNSQIRHLETQEPLVLAGYHHEWGPGSHTLFLTGWLEDTLQVTDPIQNTLLLFRDPYSPGPIGGVLPYVMGKEYQSELGIFTAEAQHIFQTERYAVIVGGRGQAGEFHTQVANELPPVYSVPDIWIYPSMIANEPQDVRSDFLRWNVYGYAHWQVVDALRLIGGISYDYEEYPVNFRYAPIASGQDSTDLVAPKAGLIWTPLGDTTLRAAYSQSLGGVSLDQSFRLEPSQVAGFNQAWRSLIPESVGGASSAARFETWNVSLEQKFPTRTYLSLAGEILESKASRVLGVFEEPPAGMPLVPSGTPEKLEYQERSVMVSLNQLVGKEWAFGTRYRLSQAELNGQFTGIPSSAIVIGDPLNRDWEALLHQVDLYVIYNHRSGFFGSLDALWTHQQNRGYPNELPGDEFWQVNAFVGYRFARRQAEARLGILNLTDQDYRLNPLNLMSELPRERTLVASFKFMF